jgi:hypothetical protein
MQGKISRCVLLGEDAMHGARQLYCSRCGGAFISGTGPVNVFVEGAPACPDCGGSAFLAALCRWCDTAFLWSTEGGDACPMCTHSPYWAR